MVQIHPKKRRAAQAGKTGSKNESFSPTARKAFETMTSKAIRQAVGEFDYRTQDAFLNKYKFGPAKEYFLNIGGTHYDSKAIVGVAAKYLPAIGRPLRNNEFSGGERQVEALLKRLSFRVDRLTPSAQRSLPLEQIKIEIPWDCDIGETEIVVLGKPKLGVEEFEIGTVWTPLTNRRSIALKAFASVSRNKSKLELVLTYKRDQQKSGAASNARAGKAIIRWNDKHTSGKASWTDADPRAADRYNVQNLPVKIAHIESGGFIDDAELEIETPEGRKKLVAHLKRERSGRLIREFKNRLTSFRCVVCHFDFEKRYGPLGRQFIEAHHEKPLAQMRAGSKTRLRDLKAVCSNCHRMIHKMSPALSLKKLKSLLRTL
jgi:5-methylcytosine-specific restriction protein A